MKFVKEPLLHFLVLALILFAFEFAFTSSQKQKINVSRQTSEFLVKQREDLMMRKINPAEKDEIIESFIEDEILYSEAYKRGLDKGDSRMRKNLILKMRGLLNNDLKDPTQEQMKSYYHKHRDKYLRPASVSVDHVYFSQQMSVPKNTLQQLASGIDHKTLGESRLGHIMPNLTQEVLLARFGREGAGLILAINDNQWHGPFKSIQGQHFIRVYERSSEHQMSYEEMKPFLKTEWLVEQSRTAIKKEIDLIKTEYEIIIENSDEPTS